LVFALFVATERASAAFAFYHDRDDFLAAAGGVRTEDLEDNPVTGTPDSAGGPLILLDGLRASATSHLKILDAPAQGNANTTPLGSRYLTIDRNSTSGSAGVTFTFDQPVNAFGFNIIDVEETAGVGYGGEWSQLFTPDGGMTFFGIVVSDAFTSFVVSADTAPDGQLSFDDFVFTPEPSTPLIAGVALAASLLGRRRRRRRHRQRTS
jgi:hypothetical protein